jgi:hypothetical protein
MVLQRLSSLFRSTRTLVLPVLVLAVAACGGHKSAVEKTADAAVQAKAACEVFANFHPPTGTDQTAQINYAKASATAFRQAADLAETAAAEDPRWARLASSSKAEADAFGVIVNASTNGFTSTAGEGDVFKAVQNAKGARPVFLAECATADSAHFSSPSPSPSPTATKAKSNH